MNNMMQIFAMMKQIKENPIAVLSQRFNLPQGISSNPQDLVEYLLKSGQISQGQIDQARQMRDMFMK